MRLAPGRCLDPCTLSGEIGWAAALESGVEDCTRDRDRSRVGLDREADCRGEVETMNRELEDSGCHELVEPDPCGAESAGR